MKKESLKTLCITLIATLVSSLVSVAATGNLFDSNEVVYDNTSSGMNSSNVKAAVDELYAAASDYSGINTRVTNLESHYAGNQKFTNISALELNENGYMSTYGGYIDFHYGSAASDFTSRLIEDSSGSLNLYNANNTAKLRVNGSQVLTESSISPVYFQVTHSSDFSYTHNTCYKSGRVITCSLWITSLNDTIFPQNSETVVGNIPSDYRPNYTVWGMPGYVGVTTGNTYYKINTNGNIIVSHRGGTIEMLLIGITYVK